MKIKGMDLDQIFSLLASLTEGEENLSDAKVRTLLRTAYTQLTGKYGPIVRAAPALSVPIAKDLAPIIAALIDVASGVGDTVEFKRAVAKFARVRAEHRMVLLKAYKNVGFSGAEAFQLVLQDASRHGLSMPNMSGSSSKE